jgi:membrane protein required for colicin V production
MALNPTDLVILGIVLVSGLWALMRGLVREVLGVVGWIGAAFATLYLYAYVVPYARQLIAIDLAAQAATGIAIFLLTLILLSIISSAISSRIRESGFNPLDRTLGFVYGLARGFVLICVAYLVLTWTVNPTPQPEWLASARLLPLIQRGADVLNALVPKSARDAADQTAQKSKEVLEQERTLQELTSPTPKRDATPDPRGYDTEQRRDLDRLIQGEQNQSQPTQSLPNQSPGPAPQN